MGAADRRRSAARHFLGGGRHLVHGRGHLLDLPALAADRLVAARRYRMHLLGLTLDLGDGVTDLFNQVMDAPHGAVEHLTQLAQFIVAAGLEIDRHVAGRDLVHYRAKALQRVAGRGIEAAIQVDDQQEYGGQRRHQQNHVQTVLGQALLELLAEKLANGGIERVGLFHQAANLLVEPRPRRIEGVGHHHLFFDQFAGLLERRLTAAGQAAEPGLRARLGGQRLIQADGIVSAELFQLQ
ncbi:hypothetical protein D3C80_730100 [compost metagenome]